MQNNDSIPVTQELVKNSSWQRIDDFFQHGSSQYSSDVQLEEGQSILLEAAHCNGPDRGHMQVREGWLWGPQGEGWPQPQSAAYGQQRQS